VKRSTWLLIAAIVPFIFGTLMMVAPEQFASGMMVAPISDPVSAWVRFLGTGLVAIGWINFMARKSPWSSAVRGILTGNILLHVLGIATDWYAYSLNVVTMVGAVQGLVIHGIFIVGFSYQVTRGRKEAPEASIA
jgi:hypothetical protein